MKAFVCHIEVNSHDQGGDWRRSIVTDSFTIHEITDSDRANQTPYQRGARVVMVDHCHGRRVFLRETFEELVSMIEPATNIPIDFSKART